MADLDTLARPGLFEARAPRYTSYPASPHFHAGVGGGTMARWLDAVEPGTAVSLYVHIPFCARICWFCACRTQGARTEAPLRSYLDALAAEIAQVAARLRGVRVRRLHLGGGTPTILSPTLLRRLGALLAAHFTLEAGAAISAEIDPTMLDEDRLDALARFGLTWATLGIQDFAPAVQRAIGRAQSVDETRRAIDGLRARGIRAITLEVLHGLPFQTAATFDATLGQALSFMPDRIALPGYAHVPWIARRQMMIPVHALPDGPARLGLARQAAARFAGAGFHRVGIDHFARAGDRLVRARRTGGLRRGFEGCVEDDTTVLIGLGASAVSRFPQGYAQNAPSTSKWQAAVRAGGLATTRGFATGPEDRLRGALIERLLCDLAAAPADIAARTGTDPGRVRELLRDLAADWPEATEVRDGDAALVITAPEFARLIARDLDTYASDGLRHSLAV